MFNYRVYFSVLFIHIISIHYHWTLGLSITIDAVTLLPTFTQLFSNDRSLFAAFASSSGWGVGCLHFCTGWQILSVCLCPPAKNVRMETSSSRATPIVIATLFCGRRISKHATLMFWGNANFNFSSRNGSSSSVKVTSWLLQFINTL